VAKKPDEKETPVGKGPAVAVAEAEKAPGKNGESPEDGGKRKTGDKLVIILKKHDNGIKEHVKSLKMRKFMADTELNVPETFELLQTGKISVGKFEVVSLEKSAVRNIWRWQHG